MSESIYNIIPKEYVPPPKQKLYKSKYPPNLPPTGTTFGNFTTSKPKGANLSGEFHPGLQSHTQYGETKTFGHLKGDRKPDSQKYLKMKTGTMGDQMLPPVRNFSYDCRHKKDPVPLVHEKPVMGQQSRKNFIISNAIENILSTAKKAPEQTDYLKKKDYGITPDYLKRIQQNINNEYTMIQNLHAQQEPANNCLTQEQVYQLREGLKRKWDQINKEYQKITYIKLVDTLGLKNRKEKCERQMAQIEADIKKLNKAYVFVD